MLLVKNPNLWASIDEILNAPEVNQTVLELSKKHEPFEESKKQVFKKNLFLDYGFSDDENNEDLIINTESSNESNFKKSLQASVKTNESII